MTVYQCMCVLTIQTHISIDQTDTPRQSQHTFQCNTVYTVGYLSPGCVSCVDVSFTLRSESSAARAARRRRAAGGRGAGRGRARPGRRGDGDGGPGSGVHESDTHLN